MPWQTPATVAEREEKRRATRLGDGRSQPGWGPVGSRVRSVEGVRVLTHLGSTRCSGPLYCAVGQTSGCRHRRTDRQTDRPDTVGTCCGGRICGFILLCIGWTGVTWSECAASPAQPSPRHKIQRVLAAHRVIKPAPQFPPTREAPPSVPSLLPGRGHHGHQSARLRQAPLSSVGP